MSITTKKIATTKPEYHVEDKTGEVVEIPNLKFIEKDVNFHKTWIDELWLILEPLANQYVLLWFWIIKNVNPKNQLIKSFKEIEKETGIAHKSLCQFMKTYQEKNGMVKIRDGVYMLNPEVCFKGNHDNRSKAIKDYQKYKMKQLEDLTNGK